MSDGATILWLEKDGKRWGLVERTGSFGAFLVWVGAGQLWLSDDNLAYLPGGAHLNDTRAPITRDAAVALIRKHAPAFGYVVRELVVAGAWCDSGGRRVRPMPGSITVYAESCPDGRWGACAGRVGWDARGDASSGPAGMAAADHWLTEHAPWVTLEGGAYTVPEVVPVPDRVEPTPDMSAPAPDLLVRLDNVVRRLEALEAARGSVATRDPRVDPQPGDVLWDDVDCGTVYIVQRCESRTVYYAWSDMTGEHSGTYASLGAWHTMRRAATVLRVAP